MLRRIYDAVRNFYEEVIYGDKDIIKMLKNNREYITSDKVVLRSVGKDLIEKLVNRS